MRLAFRSSFRPIGWFAAFALASTTAILACGDDAATTDTPVTNDDGGSTTNTPPSTRQPGDACTSDADCESTCIGGKCATPTISDGKISPSLGETDVDCGGTQAPHCAAGKGCKADADCTTSVCGAGGTCALALSCKGSNGTGGIETCGSGEVGAADAKHESCCTSLPLPGSTTRALDRYLITAGRIRAFITALAAANGGDPNLRAWAVKYAADHPDSQLGKVEAGWPGFLEAVFPSSKAVDGENALAWHLGVTPLDPMNELDGCFVGPDSEGHPTYWQEPDVLKTWGVGYGTPADGTRKFSREELDTKPMNCVMSITLAAFCAWDGGELATAQDYRAVWGQKKVSVTSDNPAKPTSVAIPWAAILEPGQFNWRNGHGGACPAAIEGWPGCETNQPRFYPTPPPTVAESDDDTPSISAPGRFPMDVTAITSANGQGWLDIDGDFLQAIWLKDLVDHAAPANRIENYCDTNGGGGGLGPCSRRGKPGILRVAGLMPQAGYVGFSFEGHSIASNGYFTAATDDETKVTKRTMTFQYGKLGGRCARNIPSQ